MSRVVESSSGAWVELLPELARIGVATVLRAVSNFDYASE